MLQIKKRKDGRLKKRFMATICFYQDGRHEETLSWIREILGIGYLSRRRDGMTELRINGFKQVQGILRDLRPFIRFKKEQAEALYKATDVLCKEKLDKLSRSDLCKILSYILTIQNNNYITKRKKTKEELMKILGLIP